jgi:hypothetical protein
MWARSSTLGGGRQCLGHRLVEPSGLLGAKHRAHREDVLERRLLQFAHGTVRSVDRPLHGEAISMFAADRGGKIGIGCAQFAFKALAPLLEAVLKRAYLLPLGIIERKLAVDDGMDAAFAIPIRTHSLPDPECPQRDEEGKNGNENVPSRTGHAHEPSRCDGAASGTARSGRPCA